MAILEQGEHLDALFQCQLLKIAAAMTAWATVWQKTSSFYILGFDIIQSPRILV
jgi:hypothetical protein